MAKFKMRMKLQGLELEIEGTREDIPVITENLSRQLGGLFEPAGAIIEGKLISTSTVEAPAVAQTVNLEPSKGKRRRTTPRSKTAPTATDFTTIDWKHDPSKFASPKQAWSTAQKAIWLIYVAKQAAGQGELSSKQITETFNKHFKQAGSILTHNVARDLGKQKAPPKGQAPIGEDTRHNPPVWFLTDEGLRQAQQLITEALASA